MLNDLLEGGVHKVTFVQDPFYEAEDASYEITEKAGEDLLEATDLVIECAMTSVLKENFDRSLDLFFLLPFDFNIYVSEGLKDKLESSGVTGISFSNSITF